MNVAVIGTGGREHALAKKCSQSQTVEDVYVIPGNSGMLMDEYLHIVPEWNGDFSELNTILVERNITFVIVGNEAYLAEGIVDYFSESDITVFGTTKKATQLESSKQFAKQFMKKYDIPTASSTAVYSYEEGLRELVVSRAPYVIKQDGLALGKGVLVTEDFHEAKDFLQTSFTLNDCVVLEDFLKGKEFSLLTFVHEGTYNMMIPARDYKRAYDDDKGPNTGGMGVYAPVEYITDEDLAYCEKYIIQPTIQGLKEEGISFTGILYAGLMKTMEGVKVIEYNTRFGDPETEVLMEAMSSDLMEVINATLNHKTYPIKWKSGITLGVCMASIGYPNTYSKGNIVSLPNDITVYSMALSKEEDTYTNQGGRVLFVVDNGPNIETVRDMVYHQIDKVQSDSLFYRKDIGK